MLFEMFHRILAYFLVKYERDQLVQSRNVHVEYFMVYYKLRTILVLDLPEESYKEMNEINLWEL